MYLYENWELPNTSENQFYHPPLNAFLSAVLLKSLDFTNFSVNLKIEALQLLPFIYSSITLIFIKKILDKFGISETSQIFVLLICVFNPISVIYSGCISNDALVNLFSIVSIYFLIKWYQDSNVKNILVLAITLGLGSITKHSILVNYAITGIVFLWKLKQQKNEKLFTQYIIFAILLIPITFAYPIRNFILFGQKPFAVQPASKTLYIGNFSLWEQYRPLDKTLLHSSFALKDHNIFSNVLRTSVNPFWFLNHFIVVIEYFVSIVLLLTSCIGIITLLQIQKENLHIKLSVLVTSLWLFSFIMLNLTMPYSCSANARYVITPIIFLGIQLGFLLDYLKKFKLKAIIQLLSITYSVLAYVIVLIYTFSNGIYYY
ncbi:MAG: phospholipid carrier-dependent glycosyltransferase [Clostridia bacterium]|nr:phospholipid carrier-dependent glycosyltransferase [Clostridia bacterium]